MVLFVFCSRNAKCATMAGPLRAYSKTNLDLSGKDVTCTGTGATGRYLSVMLMDKDKNSLALAEIEIVAKGENRWTRCLSLPVSASSSCTSKILAQSLLSAAQKPAPTKRVQKVLRLSRRSMLEALTV